MGIYTEVLRERFEFTQIHDPYGGFLSHGGIPSKLRMAEKLDTSQKD
jgi:hypothetical protein